MKIISFDEKYLEEMAKLYIEEYSVPGYEWDLKTTKEYLMRNVEESPQYCFVAVDDKDDCLGAIFCRIDPYFTGTMLFVDALQVKKGYRGQGVGKALLKKVVEKAKKKNINGIHFLASARRDFPKNWYTKMGFKPSGWVEYEAFMKDLKL